VGRCDDAIARRGTIAIAIAIQLSVGILSGTALSVVRAA
jgi:hypothetical protein